MRIFAIFAALLFSGGVHAAEPVLGREAGAPVAVTEETWRAIDERLRASTASRNALVVAQALVDLMKQHPAMDLVVLEGRLRKLQSDVYLLASPIANQSSTPSLISRPPRATAGDLPYYLWIELNGREQMLKKRREFGTSSEYENLRKLKETGFLTTRSSAKSRGAKWTTDVRRPQWSYTPS